MKTTTLTTAALCCVALFAFGCKTNKQKSAGTEASLTTLAKGLTDANAKLAEVTASLQEIEKAEGDLTKPASAYSSNLATLLKMSENIKKHRQEMEKQGKEYFAEWDKALEGIQSEGLREVQEKRRAEVENRLAAISDQYAKGSDAWQPLSMTLQDLDQAFKLDLNPASIQAMSKEINKAVSQAGNVSKLVTETVEMIDSFTAEITAKQPVPETPAEGESGE